MNRFEFNGILPVWLMIPLSLASMTLVWWWYFRESKYARSPLNWLLPTLRAAALGGILWMLAGPAWVREWVSGELSRIAVLVDTSGSMQLQESESSQSSRLDRASQWLSSPSEKEPGWLDQQRSRFHLRLFPFSDASDGSGQRTTESTWDSTVDRSGKPTRVQLATSGSKTALGEALLSVIRSSSSMSTAKSTSEASSEGVSGDKRTTAA